MGNHKNITATKFPKQGTWLNRRVEVYFHYGKEGKAQGVIVRDDMEAPFETIIKLDDGRYVRAVECQYSSIYTEARRR